MPDRISRADSPAAADSFFGCRQSGGPYLSHAVGCGAPLLVARGLSQHKIFESEFSFTCRKGRGADSASDFAIGGFRPSLYFDNLIQRVAVRGNDDGRLFCRQIPHKGFWWILCTSRGAWGKPVLYGPVKGSPSAAWIWGTYRAPGPQGAVQLNELTTVPLSGYERRVSGGLKVPRDEPLRRRATVAALL
jgi:hypothetical protein